MSKAPIALLFLVLMTVTSTLSADDLEDGYEYFYTGDYQNAISSFERALSTAPDKTKVNYSLGVCYEKLGNLDRALTYYQRAGSYQDAPQAAARIQGLMNQQKITRLRNEAQQALDDRNYGVAEQKAQAILALNRNNTWALNLLERLDADELGDTVITGGIADTVLTPVAGGIVSDSPSDTLAVDDSLAVAGEESVANIPLWLLLVIIGGVLVLASGGFVLGMFLTVGKKGTISRAMRTLVRLLPAGMLSVREDKNISMVFFEKGEVVKALLEEEDGVKIGGRNVAEEILGPGCAYNDKGQGPWSKFADLMIEIYHRSRGEVKKPKPKKTMRK